MDNTWTTKSVEQCRCCHSYLLARVLNLGDQPLANEYIEDANSIREVFPLALNVCTNCYHGQLSIVVNPTRLFSNYPYRTGTNNTIKAYCQNFAKRAIQEWESQKGHHPVEDYNFIRVLDIGSNDGTLLNAFRDIGSVDTCGVDPAFTEQQVIGGEDFHRIITEYWSLPLAQAIMDEDGVPMDIIVAQNVFAHTDNLENFLMACQVLMGPQTLLYIQTSQANMFLNREWDVYHEHLNFFNIQSMNILAQRMGLVIKDVYIEDIHGGSYVFVLTTHESVYPARVDIDEEIEEERSLGLYDHNEYIGFSEICSRQASELVALIDDYYMKGFRCVGAGATAKGMTVINASGIILDYFIDENEWKQFKYVSIYNTPVFPFEKIKDESKNIVFLLTAWNFADEIIGKIKQLRPGRDDLFVSYFPEIVVKGS